MSCAFDLLGNGYYVAAPPPLEKRGPKGQYNAHLSTKCHLYQRKSG